MRLIEVKDIEGGRQDHFLAPRKRHALQYVESLGNASDCDAVPEIVKAVHDHRRDERVANRIRLEQCLVSCVFSPVPDAPFIERDADGWPCALSVIVNDANRFAQQCFKLVDRREQIVILLLIEIYCRLTVEKRSE